jgi:hypothetical protein
MDILFWCYRDIEICLSRVKYLRYNNEQSRIYVLYGGPPESADQFAERLRPYCQDFYCATREPDPYLKWFRGDYELIEWYESRGHQLPWQALAIVQWDLLITDPLPTVLPGYRPDQLFLSGLRPLSPDLEAAWPWTGQDYYRLGYRRFRQQLLLEYNYSGDLDCCIFMLAVLPRAFFVRYCESGRKWSGFLEYKLPNLAKIWGFDFYRRDLGVLWDAVEKTPDRPMNAICDNISTDWIINQLRNPDGWRVFHPFITDWDQRQDPRTSINNIES